MRIRYFVPRCTPDNSHGRYVLELAKRLGSEHEVSVYAGQFWPPLRRVVQCHYLPVPMRPAAVRLAALWTTSLIVGRASPADIIHIQGADAPVGNVVTAHCCNPMMLAAESQRPKLRRKLNYAIGAVAEKFCISKPSTRRIIAVSGKVKSEIEQEYGVDPQRVVVIPHGVDAVAFRPDQPSNLRGSVRQRLGLRVGDFAVLFIGGDYYLKGLPTLLKAARHLEGHIKMLVVGGKPDEAILQLSRASKLNGTVIFLGRTTEVASYFAAADCFVSPTLYDTFSLSTLEAMASGLPVIVSRAAGVSELLTNGRDGILLGSPVEVKELADGIRRIQENEALRKGLSVEGRRTAERYSWDQVARRTLDTYKEALWLGDDRPHQR